VTGGAGYIGSHAVLALVEAGRRVVVIDNLSTGFRRQIDPAAAFIEGDAGDMALVRQVAADHGVTAAMHFAGSIIVPESVEQPLKYYDNNTAKTLNFAQSAVESGIRHLIFSSTATVYGAPEAQTLAETLPLLPINPYAASKAMSERMLFDIAAACPINVGVLRYFNVAGADPKGRSGQSAPGATHLIKVAAEVVTGKRDSVTVTGTDYPTDDGTGVRDYIHVSDLADAHVVALRALEADPGKSFVYNVGYGRGASVLEVLDAVDRVAGSPITRVMGARRPGDVARLVADVTAITRDLGWKPARDDLDGIVRDALAWERRLAANG